MNKNKLRKYLIKYLFLSCLIFMIFLVDVYRVNECFKGKLSSYVIIFLFIFFIVIMFWSLLEYFQKVTGMVMEESWIGRIIFVLGVLMMIYLYKSTGRI